MFSTQRLHTTINPIAVQDFPVNEGIRIDCNSNGSDTDLSNQCRLLRHLHDRLLGPGENVWISTLADDLGLSQSQLIVYLDTLGLGSHISGRTGNFAAFTVPPLDAVSDLLAARGIARQLLEPMQGLVNGVWQKIKWLQHPSLCENGAIRFHATWKGKLPPSSVCCHDLNPSARSYVTTLPRMCDFGHDVLLVQAEKQFGLILLADQERPHPVHVTEISDPKLLGPSIINTKYRIRFSNGSESDPLTWEELDGVARLLLEQQSESQSNSRKPRRTHRGVVNRRSRAGDKIRKRASRKQTPSTPKQAAKAATKRTARTPRPRTLCKYGTASSASELCLSVDTDWMRKLADDKDNIEQFPSAPSDQRIQQSIREWRALVSAPCINMANCAVCAERMRATLVRTFAVSDASTGTHELIGPAVLDFMQTQLRQDPLLPSHMDDLPDGNRTFCCALPLISLMLADIRNGSSARHCVGRCWHLPKQSYC